MDSKTIKLSEILNGRRLTLSVAESCTGGLLGGAVTSAPGSSSYFRGGVIAYDNDIKRDILGVPSEDLEKYGAVSDQVVRAMASGVAKLFGSDCAISVSGIAGPGGATEGKPVGLVFIGVSFKGKTQSRSFVFGGGREDVRAQSVSAAVEYLIEVLAGCP